MRKKIIITHSKEIYEKFNMLHFSSEVLLKNVDVRYLSKIIDGINKESKILNLESVGDFFLIKKVNPLNFDIYLKNKRI